MRSRRAPGNRDGESMAALNAGGDTSPAHRGFRMLAGRAAVIAFAAAAMFLCWCDWTPAAGTPRVILLRGWFGVFSMGLDTVTDQLKAQGIKAEVAGHLSWQNEVAEILREHAAGRTGPLSLVGHSHGANTVINEESAIVPVHVT